MQSRLDIERMIRQVFNQTYRTSADKAKLRVGKKGATHEFDIFEQSKVIGGITTSPWKNRSGTNNTGGQDRASTELLWLSVWEGNERRVMICTDKEMAERLFDRWKGCAFPHEIEVIHSDESGGSMTLIGTLP